MYQMDIYVYFLMQTITIILGVIGAQMIYKKAKNDAKQAINNLIPELLSEKSVNSLLQALISNEKYQRFLYESGAIAGQGAKQALGGAFTGGKSTKGIIGQVIGSVVGNILGNQAETNSAVVNPTSQKALNVKVPEM